MKTKNKIVLLLFSLLLFSCEDILEEDISDKTAVVIYPLNNTTVTSNVVNFQWHEMKGATSYRLQIIAEDQQIVLDKSVTQTSFTAPVVPGNYQWRVRGENFAYNSAYSVNIPFSVIESDDLRNKQVILLSPDVDFYTNNTNLIFTWSRIVEAASYTFQLQRVTNGGAIINQQEGIVQTSLQINPSIINQDAEYVWKVKAVNDEGETLYSERRFYLDRVAPNRPINQSPLNNSTHNSNQSVNFVWSAVTDSGTIQSDVTYVIEISDNEGFTSLAYSSNSDTNSFTQTFANTGTYYWRVKAMDKANNFSTPSAGFKLVLN